MLTPNQTPAELAATSCDFESPKIGRFAVLGLGLIGCSIGLALRKAHPEAVVLGYDLSRDATARSLALSAVSYATESPQMACADAEMVFVAVPHAAMRRTLTAVRAAAPPNCIVTDACGTKRDVVQIGTALLGPRFVGGHPMAGSERSGPGAASATLFVDAPWILTPTCQTSDKAVAVLQGVLQKFGARLCTLSPVEHDRLVAFLSHLPHALAYSLAATTFAELGRPAVRLAGGSFRDMTRVARSSPDVWAELLLANRDYTACALEVIIQRLAAARDALRSGHRERLGELLREGRIEPDEGLP